MAIRTDPARLYTELLAAGIPAASFSGCRSGGPLPTVVWTTGHPTPTEDATAQAVLASHDPDSEKKDEAQRRADCKSALADLTKNNAGLDSSLPTAREKAQIAMIRALAKAVRLLVWWSIREKS